MLTNPAGLMTRPRSTTTASLRWCIAYQPPTFDTATGSTTGISPGAEAGMQIGWDDEQVTIWLNRPVGLLRDRATQAATLNQPESPLGVLGYRVDVRAAGAECLAIAVRRLPAACRSAVEPPPVRAPRP